MKRGKFIIFEGNEGTGKSTHIMRLSEYFDSICHKHIVTREPGGTEFGEKIRGILLDTKSQLDPLTEALLFYSSRIMNYRNIILDALNKGETVICDRFHFSTIVYQGMCENCKEVIDLHNALNDYFSEYISLVVYLDADIKTCLARINRRKVSDKFEAQGEAFIAKVKESYDSLFSSNKKVFRVDTADNPDKVFSLIIEKIREVIDERTRY